MRKKTVVYLTVVFMAVLCLAVAKGSSSTVAVYQKVIPIASESAWVGDVTSSRGAVDLNKASKVVFPPSQVNITIPGTEIQSRDSDQISQAQRIVDTHPNQWILESSLSGINTYINLNNAVMVNIINTGTEEFAPIRFQDGSNTTVRDRGGVARLKRIFGVTDRDRFRGGRRRRE